MPKFKITETKPAILRWEFTVEAENEEEALRMVMDGEVDVAEFVTDEEPFESSHYNVEDAE